MYYDGSVHIEEDDLCYTCEYFLKGVNCPLLEALALGVVNLDDDIVVRRCGFYKEFKRSLTLVDLKKTDAEAKPLASEEECQSG